MALYREIFWLIGDQLGTPRITAERTGKLEGVKRAAYLPYGEEIGAGVGGRRSVAQGYNQAMPRQTSSKKERDEETDALGFTNYAQPVVHGAFSASQSEVVERQGAQGDGRRP